MKGLATVSVLGLTVALGARGAVAQPVRRGPTVLLGYRLQSLPRDGVTAGRAHGVELAFSPGRAVLPGWLRWTTGAEVAFRDDGAGRWDLFFWATTAAGWQHPWRHAVLSAVLRGGLGVTSLVRFDQRFGELCWETGAELGLDLRVGRVGLGGALGASRVGEGPRYHDTLTVRARLLWF
jgi:hypothetical protein